MTWIEILEYVRFSTVVPAGTVGGSVSMTVKDAELAWLLVWDVEFGVNEVVASSEAMIITIAVATAAVPYFMVHFPDILFSPLYQLRNQGIRTYILESFSGMPE